MSAPTHNQMAGISVSRSRNLAILIVGSALLLCLCAVIGDPPPHSRVAGKAPTMAAKPVSPGSRPVLLLVLKTNGGVSSLAFSPDGKTLACGSGTGWDLGAGQQVQLWDVATGWPRWTQSDGYEADNLAFSPDGKDLVSGPSKIDVWSVETGLPLAPSLAAPDEWEWGGVTAIGFWPNSRTIVAGHRKGGEYASLEVCLFSRSSHRLWRRIELPLGKGRWAGTTGFAPDGKMLAATVIHQRQRQGSNEHLGSNIQYLGNEVWLWRTSGSRKARIKRIVKGAPGELVFITFTPGGQVLLKSGAAVQLRDPVANKLLHTFPMPDRYLLQVAVASSGTCVAILQGDGAVKLWDLGTGKMVTTVPPGPPYHGAAFIALSPDGTTLATGNEHDRTIQVWRVQ